MNDINPDMISSRYDTTIHYGVTAILQPTTIETRKSERRREERKKTAREGRDLIPTFQRSKSRRDVYCLTLTTTGMESDFNTAMNGT